MSTVHVSTYQFTNPAWLLQHWQPILVGALMGCSIVAMAYLWFYRQQHFRSSVYFQLIYADTTRAKGKFQAAATLYQAIMQKQPEKQIKWRCLSALSTCQLQLALDLPSNSSKRLDTLKSALKSITQSLELANSVVEESESVSPAKPATGASTAASFLTGADHTLTPFESVMPNMPQLYYDRGLIYDALGESYLATTDFLQALKLDPAHSFIYGYAAQQRFVQRMMECEGDNIIKQQARKQSNTPNKSGNARDNSTSHGEEPANTDESQHSSTPSGNTARQRVKKST